MRHLFFNFIINPFIDKAKDTLYCAKLGSTTRITLKKEGCEDQSHILNRNEEFQVGACIGGAFVLVPFLWIMGYKAEHQYAFECVKKKN